MKFEEKLVVMCLTGLIKKESVNEQKRCLDTIKLRFGKKIASKVNGYLKIQ